MSTPASTKKVAVGAAAAAGVLAFLRRRRRRLHNSAAEMHDTLLPPGIDEPVGEFTAPGDEGHAPGHRHLAPPPEVPTATPRGSRRRRYFVGDRSRQSRS